jgi:hypothetical protein
VNAQGSSRMTTTQWVFLTENSYLLHYSNNKFISSNFIRVFSKFVHTSSLNFGYRLLTQRPAFYGHHTAWLLSALHHSTHYYGHARSAWVQARRLDSYTHAQKAVTETSCLSDIIYGRLRFPMVRLSGTMAPMFSGNGVAPNSSHPYYPPVHGS